MSIEEAAAGGAPVGKERGSLGKCWDWMRKQDKMTLMRLFGGCGGCVTIAFGLMSIFTLSILDPPQFVNDVYHVIFGALIILAELRWTRFLKHFKFLTTFLGLGMFYVFVGGINLNSDIRDIVLAIIFMIIGILYVCVGIFRKSVNEQMPGEAFNPDVEVNGVNVKQAVRVAAVMHQIQQVGKDRNQGVDTNDTQLNDAQQRV